MPTKLTKEQAKKLGVKVPKVRRGKSVLEEELRMQLVAARIDYIPEYKATERKFRWDFKVGRYDSELATEWVEVLVEVQGGIWTKGGHSTGRGITRDCEKLNEATCAGYRVLHVTAEHIRSGQALEWIMRALETNSAPGSERNR